MPDKAQQKEEVKKLIRSILVTYPSQLGVKLTDFLRDYKEFNGSDIPSNSLGYNNVQDFLIDIPDVAQVTWERGELILRCVASESMQHIMDLVNKQKVSASQKKKRFRPPSRPTRSSYYGGGRGAVPSYRPPHRRDDRSSRGRSIPPRLAHSYAAREAREQRHSMGSHLDRTEPSVKPILRPIVKPFVRTKIRELCFSYPSGLLGSEFDQAFGLRFGRKLNFKEFGFTSLLEMFKSLEDIIQIKYLDSGGYKIFGLKGSAPSYGRLSDDPNPSSQQQTRSDISSTCPETLKQAIHQVLKENPDGIWAAYFMDEFKQSTGKVFPLQRLGYTTVVELLGTLSDIVTIERPSDKDFLLRDAQAAVQYVRQTSQEKPQGVKGQEQSQAGRAAGRGRGKSAPAPAPVPKRRTHNTAPAIDPVFKERLRQVLQRNDDGLTLLELPSVYYDQTGLELDFLGMGYSSLESLLLQLSDIVIVRYVGNSHRMFAVETGSSPRCDLLLSQLSPRASNIPEDAVGPGIGYKPMIVKPNPDEFVSVFVSNVTSLDHFWLQVVGEETTDALETVMDRLEITYCGYESELYNIPDSLIAVGQVCVAVFPEDENWHRCVIQSMRDNMFVEVFYVDYGSSHFVPRNSLKFLKNKYLGLPAQSLSARLLNLKPTKKAEGMDGQKKLLSLVTDKKLFALIMGIDKNERLTVCLCDTSSGEDCWINDLLLNEGYAEFVEEDAEPIAEPVAELTPAKQQEMSLAFLEEAASKLESFPSESSMSQPNDDQQNIEAANQQTIEEQESIADLVNKDLADMDMEEDEDISNEDRGEEGCVRYLKYVSLTEDYSAHVICWEGAPYLASAEISAFFWEKDLLRSQLRQKKWNLPKETLMKEDYPQIFEEFKHYEVKGCLESEGEVKNHITMYKLKEVLEVVDGFNHPSEELRVAIQQVMDTFNPEDPFWRGEDEDDDEGESEDEPPLNVRELEIAQEALQMMRKRIFREMNEDGSKIAEFVDQLDNVERQLVSVRKQLKQAKGKTEHGGEAEVRDSQLTSEDHFTLQCVEDQYEQTATTDAAQPYATAIPKDKKSMIKSQVAPVVAQSPPRKTNLVAPMPSQPKSVDDLFAAITLASSKATTDKTYFSTSLPTSYASVSSITGTPLSYSASPFIPTVSLAPPTSMAPPLGNMAPPPGNMAPPPGNMAPPPPNMAPPPGNLAPPPGNFGLPGNNTVPIPPLSMAQQQQFLLQYQQNLMNSLQQQQRFSFPMPQQRMQPPPASFLPPMPHVMGGDFYPPTHAPGAWAPQGMAGCDAQQPQQAAPLPPGPPLMQQQQPQQQNWMQGPPPTLPTQQQQQQQAQGLGGMLPTGGLGRGGMWPGQR